MRSIIILAIIPILTSITFNFDLKGYAEICFIESINTGGKYNLELTPTSATNYQFILSGLDAENPIIIYNKTSSTDFQSVKLNKFSTYSALKACVKNLLPDECQFNFKFLTGIDLMELDQLPGLKQKEGIDKQIQLLQVHEKNIFNSLETVEISKSRSQTVFNLMTTKTLGFGILGFVIIILVNYAFYREVRKTLKDRKLI